MDDSCIFPLLGASFEPGHCEQVIEQPLRDGHYDCHCLAQAELNYLRAYEKPTVPELKVLTKSSNLSKKLCAQYLHAFAFPSANGCRTFNKQAT